MSAVRAEVPTFEDVFTHALRGWPCAVVGLDDGPGRLPVESWTRAADDTDLAVLGHCQGPTLDVGCGPGRMTAALVAAGHLALGVDVVGEAVAQTVARGAQALRRDVFGPLPGEGRWGTALLADGNIGIGGDPARLLRRLRQVVAPDGRVVAEVAGPGVSSSTSWALIECAGVRSPRFRWSVVGIDDVVGLADRAGLRLAGSARHADRWVVVLEVAR